MTIRQRKSSRIGTARTGGPVCRRVLAQFSICAVCREGPMRKQNFRLLIYIGGMDPVIRSSTSVKDAHRLERPPT
jgi:hypothetical protein